MSARQDSTRGDKRGAATIGDVASRSGAWFRAVFDGSRDAIFLADEKARFIDANPAAAEITGYSIDELRRMSIPDLHDDEDLGAFREYFHVIMSGRPVTSEAKLRRKDGAKVVVEFSNRRIDVDGAAYMHTVARDVTQRKQFEEQLLLTADRFSLLAAATGDAVYDVDLVGGRVWRSELYQKRFGAPAEASLEQSWWRERVHPDDYRRLRQSENGIAAGAGDSFVEEYRLRRPDGGYAHVVDRAYLLRDAGGRPIRKIGALTDITERKQVEEALRRSEERLDRALEGAGLGLWDHNFETCEIVRNERWAEMLGYEPSEVEGCVQFWKNLVHPDDLVETERAAKEHEAGRTPEFRVEHRLMAKSGEWRWILNWGKVVERDASGGPLRAVGIHMDVTESRRAAEALRESEERYRAIFECAAEGILITDLETRRIRYANPAVCRMLGYSETELRQLRLCDIHPAEMCAQLDAAMTGALAGGDIACAPCRPCIRRDGSILYADISPAIMTIDGRKCVAGFINDITEQKKAAEELAEHRNHLEELVEQRTAELEASRARIRRAERLASIGTLAAGIAHEINNPLGMIMLGLEEARAAGVPPNQLPRILEQIKGDVKRCARIVKSVLRFAREEASEKWSEDLNAIIRSSLDFTREYARRRGVTLRERLAARLPRVMANATEMEQVFVNLIHNAVHASPNGGYVTLETRQSGKRVQAVVSDQGRGMSPEEVERAFDPFYTTRLEDGGTGLGLSTCHGIVTEHGGVIAIQGEPGRGARATVELPALSEHAKREGEHGATAGS